MKRRSEATKRSRATAHEKEEISGEKKGSDKKNESRQNMKYIKTTKRAHTGGAGDGWRAMSMVTAEDRKFW